MDHCASVVGITPYVYEEKRLKIEFNYRDEIAYDQELLKQLEQAVG